ncbi:MAG: bifunctional riboflavin kinase/FAD synthetase [Alphaproteobacteria bacterium]|nr:bifunctional riboflavin kinase/FAD synthetase [Alphaproteobacteria bacterium]
MKMYETCRDVPESDKGAVIAIGNFDGLHRGHQLLLSRAAEIAAAQGRRFGVLTFEPHPHTLFQPDAPPNRLTPAALKQTRLAECGVDLLFSLPFDWDFASQSADKFIHNVLLSGLGASHIVIGGDFRFGQLRAGGPEDIEKAGIPVTVLDKFCGDNQEVFSSSKIRQLLRRGDIAGANEILGWKWELRGTIVGGDRRGRDLGFPTANMAIGDAVHPAYGVYAVWAKIIDGKGGTHDSPWHPAATNIGIRPMFEVQTAQVETFIFDFNEEIYGKTLCVQPVQHLRGEAKFNTLADLTRQMEKDCALARKILSQNSPS